MTIDFEKLINWLNHYGLPQYHLHVSGHIMPLQLRDVLGEMDSERIFPVHTEKPLMFSRFMRDLRSEVIVPKKNRKYDL
jgi:ribonuclease J